MTSAPARGCHLGSRVVQCGFGQEPLQPEMLIRNFICGARTAAIGITHPA